MDLLRMIPRRYYSVEGRQLLLTNFTANVNISQTTKEQTALFIDYRIRGNESAMDISQRLYENKDYYWTIYLVNGMIDIVEDWPRRDFRDYIQSIYSQDQLNELVGYADYDRNLVDLLGIRFQNGYEDQTPTDEILIEQFSLSPIYRLDILEMEENKKRDIRLIDPDFIDQFVDTVQGALR